MKEIYNRNKASVSEVSTHQKEGHIHRASHGNIKHKSKNKLNPVTPTQT